MSVSFMVCFELNVSDTIKNILVVNTFVPQKTISWRLGSGASNLWPEGQKPTCLGS